jgi:hypothetical protein
MILYTQRNNSALKGRQLPEMPIIASGDYIEEALLAYFVFRQKLSEGEGKPLWTLQNKI